MSALRINKSACNRVPSGKAIVMSTFLAAGLKAQQALAPDYLSSKGNRHSGSEHVVRNGQIAISIPIAFAALAVHDQ